MRLVSLGLTLAHVLLEGRTFVDGLTGVFVLLGCDITGVVLSAHGPAELGGLIPVSLLIEELGGEGRLGGRGEGRSTSNEGGEESKLGLRSSNDKETDK